MTKLAIEINELPLRAKKLGSEELSAVFGGAVGHCGDCGGKNADCAGQMYCRGNESDGWYCINWGETTEESCGAAW
jgi:hypothetical protein